MRLKNIKQTSHVYIYIYKLQINKEKSKQAKRIMMGEKKTAPPLNSIPSFPTTPHIVRICDITDRKIQKV